jgi:hypothetical protein
MVGELVPGVIGIFTFGAASAAFLGYLILLSRGLEARTYGIAALVCGVAFQKIGVVMIAFPGAVGLSAVQGPTPGEQLLVLGVLVTVGALAVTLVRGSRRPARRGEPPEGR